VLYLDNPLRHLLKHVSKSKSTELFYYVLIQQIWLSRFLTYTWHIANHF